MPGVRADAHRASSSIGCTNAAQPEAVTSASTYYRNIFHQPGYIAKTWGQYFEILSIEEGIVENMQDLVVARKPG